MGRVAVRNLYVDYLLSGSSVISAVDLSIVVDGRCGHDQVSRLLASGEVNDKTLYLKAMRFIGQKQVKALVTVSIDDSIQAKLYCEVNGVVNWHYDHTLGWCVKGINFVSVPWSDEEVSVPSSLKIMERELKWMRKSGRKSGG
jgi:hypothetical protein